MQIGNTLELKLNITAESKIDTYRLKTRYFLSIVHIVESTIVFYHMQHCTLRSETFHECVLKFAYTKELKTHEFKTILSVHLQNLKFKI